MDTREPRHRASYGSRAELRPNSRPAVKKTSNPSQRAPPPRPRPALASLAPPAACRRDQPEFDTTSNRSSSLSLSRRLRRPPTCPRSSCDGTILPPQLTPGISPVWLLLSGVWLLVGTLRHSLIHVLPHDARRLCSCAISLQLPCGPCCWSQSSLGSNPATGRARPLHAPTPEFSSR